ncbi:2-methoxy-6-polyprenyl-1,4-benzoquinol methylase, mitochondrial [Anopheles aquasalis]|uniref:2-methoxy-6-polyprenyl-1,4-benzoquinol methylase, mitochondrial n=1 Tax=Anopheles aquasalis TaxID=42839 RepID=UPI00215AC820|nr:2-methoxy-6-polyprenyl-1,4-benzoquinol methylase, mitochondrial [Anopheles aquasalis]
MLAFRSWRTFRAARGLYPAARLTTNAREHVPTESAPPTHESETHFGFETVKESEKWKKVHKVFEEVAASYDLMNDAMSLGIHRVWKDIFLERLAPVGNGNRLLDMAGGTGDISFRYMKYLQRLPAANRTPSHVTVCDINQNMLDVGQKRWEKLNLPASGDTIDWVCADAEKLPFENDSFTVYTIAFGIRNCTHIDRVLSEAYRVLKPGGRFMCLEFSHVTNESLQWLYDQYSFQVIPPMGQILANQWQPYQYLVESIRKFPLQDDFKTMIENAGFKCVEYENLTFGVVAIHSGFKI